VFTELLMEQFTHYIPNFLFILLRAGIVLNLLPFIGSTSLPAQFRIGLAVAVALVLTPVVDVHFARNAIPLVVVREVMFAMIFAFAARFVFFAVDMAGQVMSNATGLSMAAIVNPEIGQTTEISQLYSIIATLLFFAIDAHHDLIAIFVKSYELAPLGTINLQGIMTAAVSFTAGIFIIALKISAPVVIIMLITNIILGFVSKAAPQMNVFFVGYPLYLFLGFLTMFLSLPVFIYVMGGYFKGIPDEIGRVLLLMKG
jgi:flagellar biosynthesis protein FliR